MSDRDKLIELLTAYYGVDPAYYDVDAPSIADHLIANGVVVSEEIAELKAHNEQLLDAWARAVGELSKANAECAQLKAKWIPVTERLPRCGERVLVTDGTAVFEVHLSISHKWVRGGLCWMDGEVTHWMPLPEPPMRKGENG